ncbi:hypothetical protein DPMN_026921, partial [Dreissena polymorpha]
MDRGHPIPAFEEDERFGKYHTRSPDNVFVETTFGANNSIAPITRVTSFGEDVDSAISSTAASTGTCNTILSHGGSTDSSALSENWQLLGVPPANESRLSQTSMLGDEEEEIIVFVELPNKKLLCRLCGKVYKDPVIVTCGHTYCRRCVNHKGDETCPVDGHMLGVVVANIAVSEQIGDMLIHCKYGCRLSEDGQTYTKDEACCPVTVKIANR